LLTIRLPGVMPGATAGTASRATVASVAAQVKSGRSDRISVTAATIGKGAQRPLNPPLNAA